MSSFARFALLPLVSSLGACGDGMVSTGVDARTGVDAAPADAAGPDAIGPVCDVPELMIILDRSGSMSQRPDGTMPPATAAGAQQTKWLAAITAVDDVAASLESWIDFGLTLYPRDPDGAGGYDCSNLDTWLRHYLPPETHDLACQPAEVLVAPGPGTATKIAESLPPFETGLCGTTPIGSGLAAARDALKPLAHPQQRQYGLLITDGADNCDGHDGYATPSLALADELAADRVKLFVVGFDGSGKGIDPDELNDLACAGHSAPSLAKNCVEVAGGGLRAVSAPEPARLYYLAETRTGLADKLAEISQGLCCGCVP